MSHLRVVGGTECCGEEPKPAEPAVPALAPAGELTKEQMRQAARRAIGALKLAEGTVREMLDELDANYSDSCTKSKLHLIRRNCRIFDALACAGIWPVNVEDDEDLDVAVYGRVVSPVKLLKVLPALQAYESILAGLEL